MVAEGAAVVAVLPFVIVLTCCCCAHVLLLCSQIAHAERVAREIEGKVTTNVHLAEERNQRRAQASYRTYLELT